MSTATREARQEFIRQTTPASRSLALANPRRWSVIVAVVFVVGGMVAGGGGVYYGNGGNEIVSVWLVALGSIAAFTALCLLPAVIWSRRHREQAERTSQLRRKVTDQSLWRHPVAFVVGLTIAVGVVFPLRLAAAGHRHGHHHYAVATLIIVGVFLAVISAGLAAAMVAAAKRRDRSM